MLREEGDVLEVAGLVQVVLEVADPVQVVLEVIEMSISIAM